MNTIHVCHLAHTSNLVCHSIYPPTATFPIVVVLYFHFKAYHHLGGFGRSGMIVF